MVTRRKKVFSNEGRNEYAGPVSSFSCDSSGPSNQIRVPRSSSMYMETSCSSTNFGSRRARDGEGTSRPGTFACVSTFCASGKRSARRTDGVRTLPECEVVVSLMEPNFVSYTRRLNSEEHLVTPCRMMRVCSSVSKIASVNLSRMVTTDNSKCLIWGKPWGKRKFIGSPRRRSNFKEVKYPPRTLGGRETLSNHRSQCTARFCTVGLQR